MNAREKEIKELLEETRDAEGKYVLRLYVAGVSRKSIRAVENVRALCEEHLRDRYELEIIDLYRNPILARDGQILALPTLVKEFPGPRRKFVGDMSRVSRLLLGLDIRREEIQ